MDNNLDVVTARLDVAPEMVRESAGLLSEDERHRADRFVFDRDRDRFVVARAQLRRLLGARLWMPPDSIEFVYGDHGKPALAPRFAASDLRFNMSHAEDLAAYAFSSGHDIGIDVEVVRPIPDADEIAARMFSRRETADYFALDSEARPLAFLTCWTRKEAFIKALGNGLHHPLDRFDVSLAPGEPARILRVDDTAGDRCGWNLQSFSPGSGLIGALVVATGATTAA